MTGYTRQHGVPAWVGEFGPVYGSGAERDGQRRRLLADQNTCFAEPLADGFAACFAGASDSELVALGQCFAFGNCLVNEALCGVVTMRA